MLGSAAPSFWFASVQGEMLKEPLSIHQAAKFTPWHHLWASWLAKVMRKLIGQHLLGDCLSNLFMSQVGWGWCHIKDVVFFRRRRKLSSSASKGCIIGNLSHLHHRLSRQTSILYGNLAIVIQSNYKGGGVKLGPEICISTPLSRNNLCKIKPEDFGGKMNFIFQSRGKLAEVGVEFCCFFKCI